MAYEKMKCLYDTERDLIDRLHGTYCRYKDKVYVVSVESKTQLGLSDPISGVRIFQIKPNDPDFDISSPEIGYVNHVYQDRVYAAFLERLPQKRYRQGLYAECCSVKLIDGGAPPFNANQVFRTKGLIDAIEGRYPPFKMALAFLRSGEQKEVALSRQFALKRFDSGIVFLMCEKKDVGYIQPHGRGVEYVETNESWVLDKLLKKAGITKENNRW